METNKKRYLILTIRREQNYSLLAISQFLMRCKCTDNGAFLKQETAMKSLHIAIEGKIDIYLAWAEKKGVKFFGTAIKRLWYSKQSPDDSSSGGADAPPVSSRDSKTEKLN